MLLSPRRSLEGVPSQFLFLKPDLKMTVCDASWWISQEASKQTFPLSCNFEVSSHSDSGVGLGTCFGQPTEEVTCAVSKPGLQKPCTLLLLLLAPCSADMNKHRLTWQSMRDPMEQSWVTQDRPAPNWPISWPQMHASAQTSLHHTSKNALLAHKFVTKNKC